MAKFTVVQSVLLNFCVLMVIGLSLSSGQTTTSKNVICYYPYRAELNAGVTTYTPSDIDTSICTHVVYSYAWVRNWQVLDSYQDVNFVEGWEKLLNVRTSNPSLKILLGVDDFLFYTPDADSYDQRQTFIDYITDFVYTWGFDGIDWQWRVNARQSGISLMEEMRAAFTAKATSTGQDPLILMFSAPGWGFITEGVDLHSLGQAVDIFHAQPKGYQTGANYDFTRFVSPMYGNNGLFGNVSGGLTDLVDAGIPIEKLHMGISMVATTFTLLDVDNTEVGASSSRFGEVGEYTQRFDQVAYYEVCKRIQEEGYTAEFDPEGLVNFAYKEDQWLSYEDPASVMIKMNYVQVNNLGGVVVANLPDDDYTGQFCNQGSYPIISTLYRWAQAQTCPYSIDYFPDPYSCQHYRQCVYDMLFRVSCAVGLYYDALKKYCVESPTTPCITVPLPQ